MTSPRTPEEIEILRLRIDGWLADQLASNPAVAAVDRDVDGPRSWFVRMLGEEKDVFTVRFHLDQRTLVYETYVMPAPEENQAAFYEHLLRRNSRLYGAAFTIGEEAGVFIQGRIDARWVDETEFDRILGSIYAWVEQYFRPALRIGFASKFP